MVTFKKVYSKIIDNYFEHEHLKMKKKNSFFQFIRESKKVMNYRNNEVLLSILNIKFTNQLSKNIFQKA